MDLLKRAAEYFKNHLSVHTFHFTTDGMAFKIKTDAEAHAKTLAIKEVKTVLRADVELADEKVETKEQGGEVTPGGPEVKPVKTKDKPASPKTKTKAKAK